MRHAVRCVSDVPVGPDDLALLTDHERARHDRLVAARDRAAHLAAHLLARDCVAELLGTARGTVVLHQRCPGCGAEGHGRPYVRDAPDVHVSLSHTRGFVAAVAADAPCGVDVEVVPDRWPVEALSPDEAAWVHTSTDRAEAFTRVWVRKEALVKAGHGTLGALSDTCVTTGGELAPAVAGYAVSEVSVPGARGALAVWCGPRPHNV